MNDIVRNTELFINILGMSRTSAVQKWDHEAFQRAFRWAYYFEQVYRKTKSKPQVVEKISSHLNIACSQIDAKLGLSPLTYADLPRSTILLRDNLLENPSLDNEFYLELVGQLSKEPDGKEKLKSQLHSLSKLKASLQILQLIQKRFETLASEKAEKDGDVAAGVATVTESGDNMKWEHGSKGQLTGNAILLRKCLVNVITQAPSLCSTKKTQLHEKLQHMIIHDRGIDVLLLAIICEDDDQNEHVTTYLLDFTEDILIPRWKDEWKSFLQLPISQMLSRVACMQMKFLDIYFDLLKNCGDQLQQELEKNDYVLLMEKSQCPPNEQMCKYYYFLMQNFLQTLSQSKPDIELKVESFIRSQCEEVDSSTPVDSNIWKKLAMDMMVSSAI